MRSIESTTAEAERLVNREMLEPHVHVRLSVESSSRVRADVTGRLEGTGDVSLGQFYLKEHSRDARRLARRVRDHVHRLLSSTFYISSL